MMQLNLWSGVPALPAAINALLATPAKRMERTGEIGVVTRDTARDAMSSEVKIYLPNMRGAAVTIGQRTHVLFQPKWRPRWSDHMHPETEVPMLGAGLIGLLTFADDVRNGR